MKTTTRAFAGKPHRRRKRLSKKAQFLWVVLISISLSSLYGLKTGQQPLAQLGSAFRFFNQTETTITTGFAKEANQVLEKNTLTPGLPLYFQKDQRWQTTGYGTKKQDNDLGHNGCALVSLAMIASYWQHQKILPTDILAWAQNNYYVQGQGTSWQIFADYANQHGYQFKNLGADHQMALNHLRQGFPLIVSVNPGTFTTTGHIMVLSMDQAGNIRAFDPNDDPEKRHFSEKYSLATFQQEAANYWVLWQ